MAAVKFTEAELHALAGLPHLAIVTYMLGIRPRMDFASGYVGVRPLISWQAIRESTYVEPHQGIKHEYASAEAIRRAAVWLEKAGLVQMKSRDRQLIFFLPLAHADFSVRKKADRPPTDQADRHNQAAAIGESQANSQEADRQEGPKADAHPVSGKTLKPTPPNPPQVIEQKQPENEGGGQGGDIPDFIFGNEEAKQRAAIAKKLAPLGQDTGQAVLDEWRAAMQAGTVKAPARLLAFFIKQAEAGEFMPMAGQALRQGRENEARMRQAREADEARMRAELAAAGIKGQGKPPSLAALVRRRGA